MNIISLNFTKVTVEQSSIFICLLHVIEKYYVVWCGLMHLFMVKSSWQQTNPKSKVFFFQHPESILLFTGTGPQFLTNNEPLASSSPPSLLPWPLIGAEPQPRPLIGWAWPSLVSDLVPGYPGLALKLSRHSASYYRQQNTVTSLSKSLNVLRFSDAVRVLPILQMIWTIKTLFFLVLLRWLTRLSAYIVSGEANDKHIWWRAKLLYFVLFRNLNEFGRIIFIVTVCWVDAIARVYKSRVPSWNRLNDIQGGTMKRLYILNLIF